QVELVKTHSTTVTQEALHLVRRESAIRAAKRFARTEARISKRELVGQPVEERQTRGVIVEEPQPVRRFDQAPQRAFRQRLPGVAHGFDALGMRHMFETGEKDHEVEWLAIQKPFGGSA